MDNKKYPRVHAEYRESTLGVYINRVSPFARTGFP